MIRGLLISLLVCLPSTWAEEALASAPAPEIPYTWKPVKFGGGGFVTGLVFHPHERGVLYARTDIGGAARWEPATGTWTPLLDFLGHDDWSLNGVESIALDPTDPERLYLACGMSFESEWPQAIYRSINRGRTLERLAVPFRMAANNDGRSNGERLAVDPGLPARLYFGSRIDGLWRSDDHAATWTRLASFPIPPASSVRETDGNGIVFVHFPPSAVVAGRATQEFYVGVSRAGSALWRTRDAGGTWELVPGQPEGLVPHRAGFDSAGTLYVTFSDRAGPNGISDGAVWKLDPSSDTWTDITPERPSRGGAEENTFGYAGLALDARNPGTLVVSSMCRWSRGDDLWRSTDGGRGWTRLGEKAVRDASSAPWIRWHRDRQPDAGNWIGDARIDPHDSDHLVYIFGGGVWGTNNLTRSDADGSTRWTPRCDGLEETGVWGHNRNLVSAPGGAPLVSTMGDIDGFRHDDLDTPPPAGQHKPARSSNTSIDFAGLRPDFMVRAHYGPTRGGFSTDGARTWTDFPACPPAIRSSDQPGIITVSADAATLVWAGRGTALYRSTDLGRSWTACEGAPAPKRSYTHVAPTADRVDPERFYYYDRETGDVWLSGDAGATWTRGAAGLPRDGEPMLAAPGHAGHLWQPTPGGLHFSTDGGRAFHRAPAVEAARCIGFGKAAPGADYPAVFIYARIAGTWGVYRSDDSGRSWARINDDRHRWAWIAGVIGDPRIHGRVYVGTSGRGLFYGDAASAVSVARASESL